MKKIKAKTLVIGITTDILFPLTEQELLAKYIPGAEFRTIDSHFGHDGFLLEYEKISQLLNQFLENKTSSISHTQKSVIK